MKVDFVGILCSTYNPDVFYRHLSTIVTGYRGMRRSNMKREERRTKNVDGVL